MGSLSSLEQIFCVQPDNYNRQYLQLFDNLEIRKDVVGQGSDVCSAEITVEKIIRIQVINFRVAFEIKSWLRIEKLLFKLHYHYLFTVYKLWGSINHSRWHWDWVLSCRYTTLEWKRNPVGIRRIRECQRIVFRTTDSAVSNVGVNSHCLENNKL